MWIVGRKRRKIHDVQVHPNRENLLYDLLRTTLRDEAALLGWMGAATIPACQSLVLVRLPRCEIRVTKVFLEVHRRATEGIQTEANKLYWPCSSINFFGAIK